MRLFLISLLSLFFLSGCEEKASPPNASISPLDAFVSGIKDIPAQSESEDYTHSFELVDYDITLSDSVIYTHNCVMRFISTTKRSDYSESAVSKYSSSFKYNAESKEWELSSLERTNIDYDFTGNEDFVKREEISIFSGSYLAKSESLFNARAEERARVIEHNTKFGQKEFLKPQITTVEKEFMAEMQALREKLGPAGIALDDRKPWIDQLKDIYSLGDALKKNVESIERGIRLQDFENVLKNTLKAFDHDESVFEKRYEYNAEAGTLNRR